MCFVGYFVILGFDWCFYCGYLDVVAFNGGCSLVIVLYCSIVSVFMS